MCTLDHLINESTIVEQVKRKYDQNTQCATISQHVDISIVNEMNFRRSFWLPLDLFLLYFKRWAKGF